MNDENHFKERIIKVLSKHPEGLSIAEISQLIDADRHTVAKYIHELIGGEKIYQRDLGTIKLHYLPSRLIQPVKEKEILEKLKRHIK